MKDEVPKLGSHFAEDAAGSNAFSKLARYEAAIEGSLYRALNQLRTLQSLRGKRDLPSIPAVNVAPTATKRSGKKSRKFRFVSQNPDLLFFFDGSLTTVSHPEDQTSFQGSAFL